MSPARPPEELYDLAVAAASHARVPYSRFPVGATVETASGQVYSGCNVETWGMRGSTCAERNALFQAVAAEGPALRVVGIAVHAPAWTGSPCGVCRQVADELTRGRDHGDVPVHFRRGGTLVTLPLSQLLPVPFELDGSTGAQPATAAGELQLPRAARDLPNLAVALAAARNAHVPYGHLREGAALLSESGAIHIGSRVENGAWDPTSDAAVNAALRGVAVEGDGFRPAALLVVREGEDTRLSGPTLEALVELGGQLPITVVTGSAVVHTALADLLRRGVPAAG